MLWTYFSPERRLQRRLVRQSHFESREIDDLRQQVLRLIEQLEAERSANRIKQLEIDLLAAINVRNIARVTLESAATPKQEV